MALTLYKHQQEILDRNPARHLIAFDRGTGKTLTGLLLAGKNNTATGTDITYIIVPKKVKSKWQDDTKNFKDDINALLGCDLRTENVIIMTKEEFKRDCKTLLKPKAVVVDEAHYFAGVKSQLSKSLQWFVRYHKVSFIWLMTATPYLSTPWNIYTLGRCLGYDLQYQAWLRSFFVPKYLGMKVIHVPDESKSAELQEYVRSIGTVVGMEEVVDEVPEQEDKFIHVALTPEQKEALLGVDMLNPLTGFGQKHQIENGVRKGNEYEPDTLIPDYKSTFLLDFKRNYPKMAVFARYTLQVEKYAKMFEEAGYETLILSGKTKDAGEVIKRAVEAENVAVVIQAQCSEGYELPNFDLCVFASLSFSYKDYTQARGRFLRINKLKANTYMHLLTENVQGGNGLKNKNKSIDMAVWNAIVKKQDFDMGLYMRNSDD